MKRALLALVALLAISLPVKAGVFLSFNRFGQQVLAVDPTLSTFAIQQQNLAAFAAANQLLDVDVAPVFAPQPLLGISLDRRVRVVRPVIVRPIRRPTVIIR